MAVTIKQVSSRRDLGRFVDFPNKLYKGNQYFVPKIYTDEMATLDPKKNPAYEFSEAALFLAYKDGKLAGRVAAIVNHRANEKWGHKEVRFGWIDFIDDREVSSALMDKVIEFGKERGMDSVAGPLGFTDFDPEGMLVEGYDQLSTMALIYNYPYYKDHIEAMGFTKAADWLEFKIRVPEQVPPRIAKISKIVSEKYGFRVRKLTKREIRRERLGYKIFEIINDCYGELFDFTPLTSGLIDKYVDAYLGLLNLDYVSVIVDKNNEMLAVGITMPSITRALQKCRGKFFPLGWFHLLRSMFFKNEGCVELLLIAVRQEYRNLGLIALILNDLVPRYYANGVRFGESNAELETNTQMIDSWKLFDTEQHKRRRAYKKDI